MKTLAKNYDHKETEPRLQKFWEEQQVYAWEEDQPRENTFVIDTPPPTVSGILHMGHIFSYTQADFVARYQRMSGKTVFYPMGFDDNGLPTERLVEKEKKVRGRDMPRADFVNLCREVVQGAEEEFRRLFKSTGISVDWKQEYQTISDDVSKLSQESFLDLAAKGHAYRDFRPTYWDWVDGTAVAQAEIENKEMAGVMNEIEFTLEDGSPLIIATTRPELLGACVAVMYHPEDVNAAKYAGKHAITPLFGVKVPMIADDLVEKDKGTGIVMCCTFGDDTDKEWWRKHHLPMRAILSPEGKISSEIEVLNGLKPKQAQAKILELLQAEGKVLKQTPIMHTVKCAERSGTPIEIIPTSQWFIRVVDKKEALLKKADECNWYPDFMQIRVNQWIEGLREDWCISRQRFFGVPFPVWYSNRKGEEGKIIYADIEQLPIDPLVDSPKGYSKDEVVGSTDIMDTWATSSISPQINARALNSLSLWERARVRENKLPLKEELLKNARDLRKSYTDAEQILWSILRNRQVQDFKFRRQHPIEPYIVDFFCDEAKLIIELDGGQHSEDKNIIKDENRTKFLESKGYKVIRFWNNEVLENIEGVYDIIVSKLPHPAPLPEGEGTQSTGDRFAKLFPADIRPQAHEIIRTWAFYTIVKAYLHSDSIPWKNLMISGWCLAADKTKMSKSKGNVVTPVDLIEEKSADVVRYWASTSRLGADTAFSEDLLKIGRKLVNKLWNATSFAAIHLEKLTEKPTTAANDIASGKITETLDKWILSRLGKTIAKATAEFEKFEYCDARVAVEEFFWNDFCDNYLELVKARAYEDSQSAYFTIYHCLNALLKLFAPFIPHITEELYNHIFDDKNSLHARGSWAKSQDFPIDENAEKSGWATVTILETIRKAKSEKQVSIKFPVKQLILPKADKATLEPVLQDLLSAGNVEEVVWGQELTVIFAE